MNRQELINDNVNKQILNKLIKEQLTDLVIEYNTEVSEQRVSAGTVGKPASSDPPHLGESSPPTPPAVQGPPRPPGVHLQLPSFAMLPFGDKTRYFLQHCPSLSQFSRGARWGRVLCWVVAPGSHWLGDALLKMRSLTFLSSFTFLQM